MRLLCRRTGCAAKDGGRLHCAGYRTQHIAQGTDETVRIAKNTRSQTISNYFPHIGVVGSYQWSQKNLELVDYGSMMYGMLIPAEIRHLTRIDIQNVMVVDVALVQPVFLGGKLIALNQMVTTDRRW